MSAKKLYQIILCNSIGIALFLSWYLPVDHGFWASMDRAVFFYFNQHLLISTWPKADSSYISLRLPISALLIWWQVRVCSLFFYTIFSSKTEKENAESSAFSLQWLSVR